MSDSTLYKRIYNFLLDIIVQNSSIPDFKLPSERTLALKFNASRRPVRLAYEKLMEQDYVETIHGKGYFIKNTPQKLHALPHAHGNTKITFIAPSIKTIFMQQILSGISKFCDEYFIDLSIKVSDANAGKEKKLLQNVLLSDTKGIILFPIDKEIYSDELLKLSIGKYPVAIVDRYLPSLNLSYVATDNYQAMVNAVEFLHQKHLKKITFVSPPQSINTAVEERINGFNHGLFKYYGMAMAHSLLKLSGDAQIHEKTHEKILINYLKKYPETEVIITMGVYAPAVFMAASKLGISIPHQLKLMIFDDELSRMEKETYKPYIIQQDGQTMGYLAAQALYNQIYGDMRVTIKKLPVHILDYSKNHNF